MTTNKETEAFGLIIERQKSGAYENDIRTAFQHFAATAGIATMGEITTEVPPGIGNSGRMDLYVHNTCVEFKRDILRAGAIAPDYVAELDSYLKQLVKAGAGVQNGILTDGVNFLIRRPGDDALPDQKGENCRVFDAEEKVDRIIGNPPWLTYGQSADIIREELRGMSEKRYQIWAGGKLAPHQDIATLFYTRCAELYAKMGAKIGMVMPHSALRTGQHLKWCSGNYKQKGGRNTPSIGLNFQVHEPWDLDNVVPDFFPMPASVVFATYAGAGDGTALAPGTVQVWRGNWQENYDGISRKSEALHHDDGKFKSPYAELSSQGQPYMTAGFSSSKRCSTRHCYQQPTPPTSGLD